MSAATAALHRSTRGMVAKFVAGPPYTAPGIGNTATWRFGPSAMSYLYVVSNRDNENYNGFLMGEVSGNWLNTGARTVVGGQWSVVSESNKIEKPITVTPQHLASSAEKEIVIPVSVEGISDSGIISYEFDLKYDASVIQPLGESIDLGGTVSRGLSFVTNAVEPGLLRVVVYGAMPIDSDGVLLNLRFKAVGAVGSGSPLTFERIIFNEGESQVSLITGQVEISAAR
ncbi:MAG: cohesin domain-containing protein [Pyrinomonadaceae bacterium]